ncbi:predicted protein [Sclerotinia sclerotiorum 1980 UF-70]|uniref:Uncharacterized protein n=1 Tax=Sclerotinia sclerotiorum (strain ATCC 18683 / 1980 / Ss-1) TaxID=665079 RepID=A7EXR2_SCLS1|nr:predicted protein [Sclerotinia sclerotiorum 1980 UF-70]EDN94254.1 predicted protein [Sclerotinia sclerotiorum 1980 UF-70]
MATEIHTQKFRGDIWDLCREPKSWNYQTAKPQFCSFTTTAILLATMAHSKKQDKIKTPRLSNPWTVDTFESTPDLVVPG